MEDDENMRFKKKGFQDLEGRTTNAATSWESDITTSSLLLLHRLHINSLKLKRGQTANVEFAPPRMARW